MDVEALLRPVVTAEGLEIYDVTHGRESGRTVLRIEIEGPDGVDIDTLGRLTKQIAGCLDDEGYGTGPYDLQVSSPGIERPLRRPEHFRRAVGDQVKVKTTTRVAGARTHSGTLADADDRGITLEVDGAALTVTYGDIASARTVVDWSAELKRSNA